MNRRAALSVFVFGVYLALGGTALLLTPSVAGHLAGLPSTGDGVWARLCGMFFLYSAFYCFAASASGREEFLRWSVVTRSCTLAFLAAFVLAGGVTPALLCFGVIDLAAAAWTLLALRADKREQMQVSRSAS